jgi:hypothetical protein
MREILIRPHLGLGDALICNAIVRYYAQRYQVTVFAKPPNTKAVAWMFRDDPNITVFEVDGDEEADAIRKHVESHQKEVLGLGFYGEKPFAKSHWDQEFYRQAKIAYPYRWHGFKVSQQLSMELPVPKGRYIFAHDDPDRKCLINPDYLPKKIKVFKPKRELADNLFSYWSIIENAEEIHCMESCFAILVDHLPVIKAKRIVLHLYTRESIPPKYQRTWERITERAPTQIQNESDNQTVCDAAAQP